MAPRLAVLAACVLSAAPVRAQTPPSLPASTPTGAPQQGAYTIELQQMRVRFEDAGTDRREMTLRVRVNDEVAVRRWGQIPLVYQSDTEDLQLTQVEIQKPDGSIVATSPQVVQDLAVRPSEQLPIFLDVRQKQITVAALRPGDVLRLTAVWATRQPIAPGQFWFAYSFNRAEIVEDERLEIDVPAARKIGLDIQPGAPVEASGGQGTMEGDRRVYRWKTSHASSASTIESPRNLRDAAPADIRLSSFRDWTEFAAWYRSRLTVAPDAQVREKVAALTSGLSDDAAKIAAIYRYVSSEIRYVSLSFGVGRFVPHAPGDVLKNQYGDCKDKVALLSALLAALNIDTIPVVLNNTRSISDTLASPLEIDHMIVAIPHSPDARAWTWLDPTLEVAPVGMLAMSTRDRRALALGSARTGSALVRTPADPPFASLDRIDLSGEVNEIGVLKAHVTMSFRGDVELAMRSVTRALPREALSELAAEVARLYGVTADLQNVTTSDPAVTANPFEIRFDFRQKGFLNWAAGTSEITVPATFTFPFARDEERVGLAELPLTAPKTVHLRCVIGVPPAYTLRAPVDVRVANAGLTYMSTYTVDGHRLIADREIVATARTIAAADFGAYTSFVKAAQADFAQHAAVTGSVKATPDIPTEVTARELYSAAFDAYSAKRYDAAAAFWKRTTELDPKMGDAWISLGLAYDRLERYDEAIAAIRTQLDRNPRDARAHGDLGRILERADRTEEAIAEYKKHLEINPLDGDVTKNLGLLYADDDRYPEALPYLEKADTLVKPDAWMLAQLGAAYLDAKQLEKARAAFTRALGVSTRPAVRVKIAWKLAQAGVDLDRAVELASAAEEDIAKRTAQLELTSLRNEHLALMETLGWAWDALGSAHFQSGRIEEAGRDAEAAWSLGGRPIMAYHLGRVQEKRGRLADALSYYLTAQSTSSAPTADMIADVKRLAGGGDLRRMLDSAKQLAPSERVVRIGANAPEGTAQFFAILDASRSVREVQFRSGAEALRPLEAELRQAALPLQVPSDFKGRLVVAVGVSCNAKRQCTGGIAYPDDVTLEAPKNKLETDREP